MSDRPNLVEVPLHTVAHARTGDKGNRLSVSLIPYKAETYPYLLDQITPEAVRAWFSERAPGEVTRYELAKLPALNFVIDDILEGGVNTSLNLDGHGKSLSFRLLSLPVRVPPELAE